MLSRYVAVTLLVVWGGQWWDLRARVACCRHCHLLVFDEHSHNVVVWLCGVWAWVMVCAQRVCSGFTTHGSMKDPQVHSHVGACTEPHGQAHAMTVVGWRRTEEGSLRLLVQNWWWDKQFMEVDLAYLGSRRAHLTWIASSVPLVPAHLPLSHSDCAEVRVTGADTGTRPDRGPARTGPRCN